jgi:hypothetical protein
MRLIHASLQKGCLEGFRPQPSICSLLPGVQCEMLSQRGLTQTPRPIGWNRT